MYLIGNNAWGQKDDSKNVFYVSIDKRFKDLELEKEILEEYAKQNNVGFILSTVCRYEKLKDVPTEEEYFIKRYGIKILDTQKPASIDESIIATEYALAVDIFRKQRIYYVDHSGAFIHMLLRLYLLKNGLPVNKYHSDLEKEIEIAKIGSKDEAGLEIIEQYLQENDEAKRLEICKEFEQYIKKMKQVKYEMKLSQKPTMKVYERLVQEKKKKGKLDFKNITKEELYILYVTQRKSIDEISALYNVTNRKISDKKNQYKVKMIDITLRPERLGELIDIVNKEDSRNTYTILKHNFLDFEQSIFPILNYMKDGDTYLLKEFWQFVQKNEDSIIESSKAKNSDTYYKAELCVDLLVQNELIKEVDYKQYKITKKGKDFLKQLDDCNIQEVTIPIMVKYLDNFKYYNLEYHEGYPTDENEIIQQEPDEIKSITPKEQSKKLTEFAGETNSKCKKKTNVKTTRKQVKTDYLKMEKEKKDLGDFCEEMVLYREREMLKNAGRTDLLDEVIWISKEKGDGTGYDIESVRKVGNDYKKIYIEVKGTNKNQFDDFYITINEILASQKYKEQYYICQIINAKKQNPKIKYTQGEIDKNFKLEPILYKAQS